MEKAHEVTRVRFEKDRLVLVVDGRKHAIPLADCSRKLLDASAEERARFVISASGYGIHWPDLDEDLSVDRLIGVPPGLTAAKPRRRTRRPGASEDARPHHR